MNLNPTLENNEITEIINNWGSSHSVNRFFFKRDCPLSGHDKGLSADQAMKSTRTIKNKTFLPNNGDLSKKVDTVLQYLFCSTFVEKLHNKTCFAVPLSKNSSGVQNKVYNQK